MRKHLTIILCFSQKIDAKSKAKQSCATEQTLIKRQKAATYVDAFRWMKSWYKEEELRKFAGYDIKTKRLTYGEWLQQEEAKLWKD